MVDNYPDSRHVYLLKKIDASIRFFLILRVCALSNFNLSCICNIQAYLLRKKNFKMAPNKSCFDVQQFKVR